MAGDLEPLDLSRQLVNENGTPTLYFIRWAQARQIDIGEAITLAVLEQYLLEHPIQAGTGINVTPTGNLTDSPTITLEDTAVTPDTYGDATNVPQITVDQQGRITGVVDVAISGGGGGGDSWSNGIGFRIPLIIATATGSFVNDPNTSLGADPLDSFYWNSTAGSQSLLFDFQTALTVSGIIILQSTATAQGVWDFEGSPDNATWTVLDASFSWTPATFNGRQRIKRDFTNTTDYRYYRLRKVSGSTSSTPFVNWFAFKCSGLS